MLVKKKKYVDSISVKFGIIFFPPNKMMNESFFCDNVGCNTWFFSGVPLKHLSKQNVHKRVEIRITENVRD